MTAAWNGAVGGLVVAVVWTALALSGRVVAVWADRRDDGGGVEQRAGRLLVLGRRLGVWAWTPAHRRRAWQLVVLAGGLPVVRLIGAHVWSACTARWPWLPARPF